MILLRGMVVSVLLMMGSSFSAWALDLRKDVQELRASVESRARSTLQAILGPDARVVVSVEVKAVDQVVERAPRKAVLAAPVDLGYVPQAFSSEPVSAPSLPSPVLSEVRSVQIQALIPPETESGLVAAATKALEMQFAPERAEIRLTKMEGLAARKPASSEPEKKSLEKPEEKKPDEQPWLPWAIGGGVGSLVMLGAAWLLSRGMAKTGAALAEGLRSLAPRSTPGVEAMQASDVAEAKPESTESEAAERVRLATAIAAQAGNIALVARIVRENPVRFVTCIGANSEDFRGLRSLLVQLDDLGRKALQAILSEEVLARVNSSAEGGESFGFSTWLQDFCERLATSHLLGTKLVESQVDGANLVALLKADSAHLLQAAESVGMPAGWRIVSELLQAPALKSVFERGTAAVLEGILLSADVSGVEVRAAADRIVAALSQIPQRQETEVARRRFLAGSLLPGVLQALQSMDPGEDERLLEGLAARSPSLHEMVEERFWGVSMLDRIPELVLLQSLESYEVEDRALLLAAVPESRRQNLIALLPEGMAKVILKDLVDRKTSRRDPIERRQAVALFRNWIAGLKRQSDAGLFSPAPSAREAVASPRAA